MTGESTVVVRPLAEQDLFQAQAWYDDKSNGLGTEFRAAGAPPSPASVASVVAWMERSGIRGIMM